MLIYSNNNCVSNSSSNLFGDVNYKSVYDRKQSINRTRVLKRDTTKLVSRQRRRQRQNKRIRTKKLTVKNIKFLKSLGLRVKNV